jgi:probable H4MPT-linked C1 transfer pathway protein
MSDSAVIGWDLGGAHLKAARLAPDGRVEVVVQLPCPLWQGLAQLERAVDEACARLGDAPRHAVTMTGELADLFASRAEGVRRLIAAMTARLPAESVRIYAGPAGFLTPGAADDRPYEVASANWHASVRLVARRRDAGLVLDVGSTTTDVVPFGAGQVLARGYTDPERLVTEELVYTGVTRTPVMALARSMPFAGERQTLTAELFATMADVYRLTGELPEDADPHPAADGGGKQPVDSARRLARMLGRDLEAAAMSDWQRLARHLAERQLRQIHDALDRVASRGEVADDAALVGAGVGRFLVERLAQRTGRPYVDFADLVDADSSTREWAARCAPAVAVAALLVDGRERLDLRNSIGGPHASTSSA